MITKISKGRSFAGILGYLFEPKERSPGQEPTQEEKEREIKEALEQPQVKEDERVRAGDKEAVALAEAERQPGMSDVQDRGREPRGVIIAGNMAGRNKEELEREFKVLADLHPEVERRVFHCSISTKKEDEVTPESQARIAEKFVSRMGLVNTMWVAVRHENEHGEFHLVASRIRYDGQVIPDSKDFIRAEEVTRRLEKDFKLSRHKSSWETMRRAPTRGEMKLYERTGNWGFRIQLQAEVDEVLKHTLQLPEFKGALAKRGIQWHLKVSEEGKVLDGLYEYEGKVIRAARLGRGYTFEGLQQRWPDQPYRQGRMSYVAERDYAEICRASRGEHDRQDHRSGPGAVEAVAGRPVGGDRGELPQGVAGGNRDVDYPAEGGTVERSEQPRRPTPGRQPGGNGSPIRRAGEAHRGPYRDVGAGEHEDGREAGRPGISGRSGAEARSDSGATELYLRGAGEEGRGRGGEAASSDGRRGYISGRTGQAVEEGSAFLQPDHFAGGLSGRIPALVDVQADAADDRGEHLLESSDQRHEERGARAPDSTTQRQTAPDGTAEQHQPVVAPQQQLEQPSRGGSGSGGALDRLFKLISEAREPVDEREQQEAACLQEEAAAEAARKQAAEIAAQEQQRRAAALARELARERAQREAHFNTDLQLLRMIREEGLDCLYSPETADRLVLAFERTLTDRGVNLSDIGLTSDSISENLSDYVEGISRNPIPFLSRMKAVDLYRSPGHDNSREPPHIQERADDYSEPPR